MQRPHPNVPGPRPQVRSDLQTQAAARLAFTLLELLIAISIIAILASLILTVASSANLKAKNTGVAAEIQSLAAGIASFKQHFGYEPPSSINLYEQASGWAGDPQSMGLMRQLWPQFDFTYATEGGQIDINGDGLFVGDNSSPGTGKIPLSGAECLVFFLGGIPATQLNTSLPASNQNVFGGPPAGFSQNPVDPFAVTVTSSGTTTRTVVGSNRMSFTEFDKSRLYLYQPSGSPSPPARTMNTYCDRLAPPPPATPIPVTSLDLPYLYLSSYGGQGYNVSGEITASPPGGTFNDVYRQGPNGSTSASPSPPWNTNSYQIISPGGDQQYGLGGEYETATANTLLVGTRGTERDNITNFSSGTLAP